MPKSEGAWIEWIRRRARGGRGVRLGVGDDAAVLDPSGAGELVFGPLEEHTLQVLFKPRKHALFRCKLVIDAGHKTCFAISVHGFGGGISDRQVTYSTSTTRRDEQSYRLQSL